MWKKWGYKLIGKKMALGTVVDKTDISILVIQILKLTSYLKTDFLFCSTGSKRVKKFKKTNLLYKYFLPVAVYSNYK